MVIDRDRKYRQSAASSKYQRLYTHLVWTGLTRSGRPHSPRSSRS